MTNKAQSIVGTNDVQRGLDFYPTPKWVTQALLDREGFCGSIWECACGDGAISEVLREHYSHQFIPKTIFSSDIIDRDYGQIHDFLGIEPHPYYPLPSNIITNPPFKYAEQFVERAKSIAKRKIAFLLKTSFLEGKGRYSMFMDREFPLKCIYQFSGRIAFEANTNNSKKSGMIAFAWFVWDKEHEGEPVIRWIK